MSRRGVDGRTSRRRRTSTGRSEALVSDVLVVSAAGPTSPAPGLTVLRALAEEPRAVVCDPTGPDVEASTTPDPRPDRRLREPLGRDRAARLRRHPREGTRPAGPPCSPQGRPFPSVGSALVAAQREIPPTERLVLDLAPTAVAPGQGRRFVRSAVERWHVTHLLDRAALVVTELVTNTVVHALTPMTVTISRRSPAAPSGQGTLRIAVRDADGNLPALQPPTTLMSRG